LKQATTGVALSSRTGLAVVAAATSAQGVKVEEVSNVNAHISLKVTVSDERCRKAWDEVLKDAAGRAEVPGFRKGAKVPQSVLIGYLGGPEEVAKIACERVMRDSMGEALASVADKAIADSERIESSPQQLIASFGPDKPFVYQVGVDLPAKIEFTSDYKTIEVSVPACSNEATRAQQVEDLILQGRKDNGSMRIVVGRGMQPGDVVVIDLNVCQPGQKEPMQGASRKGYRMDTGKTTATYLAGLIEGMEGMKSGDERTIPTSFPEDWDPPQLAGMQVDAQIKLNELFEFDLAMETDDLAGKLHTDAKDMDDLRMKLRAAIVTETSMVDNTRVDAALSQALVDITESSIPQHIIQMIGQQKYQQRIMGLQSQGKISPELTEQLATPAMLSNYIKGSRKEIEDTAKASMAVEAIFQKEGMTITDQEKEENIADTIVDMEKEGIEYDREALMGQVEEMLVAQKVLALLKSTAKINMLPYDPEVEKNYGKDQ